MRKISARVGKFKANFHEVTEFDLKVLRIIIKLKKYYISFQYFQCHFNCALCEDFFVYKMYKLCILLVQFNFFPPVFEIF